MQFQNIDPLEIQNAIRNKYANNACKTASV